MTITRVVQNLSPKAADPANPAGGVTGFRKCGSRIAVRHPLPVELPVRRVVQATLVAIAITPARTGLLPTTEEVPVVAPDLPTEIGAPPVPAL